MKITKNKLKKLIKEELSSVLSEVEPTVRSGMAIFESLLKAAPGEFDNIAREIFNNKRETRELIKYILTNSNVKGAMKIFNQIMDTTRFSSKEVKSLIEAAHDVVVEGIKKGDRRLATGFASAVNRQQNALANLLKVVSKDVKEVAQRQTFSTIASKNPRIATGLQKTLGKYLTTNSTLLKNKLMGQLGSLFARVPGMAAVSSAAAAGLGPILIKLAFVAFTTYEISELALELTDNRGIERINKPGSLLPLFGKEETMTPKQIRDAFFARSRDYTDEVEAAKKKAAKRAEDEKRLADIKARADEIEDTEALIKAYTDEIEASQVKENKRSNIQKVKIKL